MFDFDMSNIGSGKVYCFLDAIITDSNKRVRVLQIVCNKKYSFETVLINTTVRDAKEFINAYRDKLILDFDITDDNKLRYCDTNVVIQSSSDDYIQNILGLKEDFSSDKFLSIYDLFMDICKVKGFYVPRYHIDGILDGTKDDGVIDFKNIRVSDSTMTISFSVFTDEGWKTEDIISVEGIALASKEFYFAVDEEDVEHFKAYNVEKIKSFKIYNRDLVIFKFDKSVPIYKHTKDSFKIFNSLITQYCRDLQVSRTIARMAKVINNSLLAYQEQPDVVTEKKPYVRPKSLKYTISFDSQEKAPSDMKTKQIFVKDVLRRKELKSGEYVSELDMRKDLNSSNSLELMSYRFVDKLFAEVSNSRMDLLDASGNYLNVYSNRQLCDEMYLYSYRASCFALNYTLGLKYDSWRIYEPGKSRYVTIRRCMNNV